jgi:predicted MPP superfamily phosphohydrolase
LHYDSSKPKDTQIVLDALWKDLDNFPNIDLILFTGDLVKAGDKKDDFKRAYEVFIDPLLQKTKLTRNEFFIVPGNHDMQMGAINPITEAGLRTVLIDREALNAFLDKEIEKDFPHIERLDHFNAFKSQFHSTHTITSNKLFSTHILQKSSTKIGIACLNSSWRATGKGSNHDKGKLLIGERQIYDALDDIEGCDIKVALYHHSLDWLMEFDQNDAEMLLSSEFDFIFCGHLHKSNIKLVQHFENKAELVQGGCLYKDRPYYNGYSVVCFDAKKSKGTIYLQSYFDDRKAFDKAINVCKNGEIQVLTKIKGGAGDGFKKDNTKEEKTLNLEEKSERDADQVKEEFKWLLEIKNPINLSKDLESLGSDEYNDVAEEFIKHSDIKNPLALGSLAIKIRKRSCVVAFVGPQLCGKSWLARNVCRFIAPNLPMMHPEVIVYNDIQRIMYNLRIKGKFKDANGNDEDILSVVRYRILAVWARRLVENALRYGLKHEEFLELRRDYQNDDLINFTENLDLALGKLLEEKEKSRITKTSKDFTIFESCINKLLPSNLKFNPSDPHVLAVEIEDLHDYEKTTSPKMDSGEKFIFHFWENLKGSVNDSEYNKEKSINRTIGIIVTTRQPEFVKDEEEENTQTDLILKISGFPKVDCQKYAKEIGLEKLLGTENLEKVTSKAFQFSKGYVWFYVRFLRSVAFLYINAKENKINVSIDQIIDAVLTLPVFWYWKAPCCENFKNIASRCLTKEKRYPKNIPDCSPFLYNIINTSENNARLINFYERCLKYPQIEMSDSDIKELLLPLLRLGLLRRDDLSQTFVPWNEIIKRHFNPDHLMNLSNTVKFIKVR